MLQITFIRWPAVVARTGLPISTISDQAKDGTFVTPVPIARRATGFPEHEIDALCAARLAGQSDDEIRLLVQWLESQRPKFWAELAPEIFPAEEEPAAA